MFTGRSAKTSPLFNSSCCHRYSWPSCCCYLCSEWGSKYLMEAYFYAGDINPRWQKFERKFVNNSRCLICNHPPTNDHKYVLCILLCGGRPGAQESSHATSFVASTTTTGYCLRLSVLQQLWMYSYWLFCRLSLGTVVVSSCVARSSYCFLVASAGHGLGWWGEAHVHRLRLLLRCANIKIYGDYGITFYCTFGGIKLNS